MEKYRILQIHNFYQIPGGEDVVVRNEKKLLEEHGHEVFTYYRSNKELNEGNKLKKLFIPFTAVYSLKTCREVKKIIRENKIDIVHLYFMRHFSVRCRWSRHFIISACSVRPDHFSATM